MTTDLTRHPEFPAIFNGADQNHRDVCAICRERVGYAHASASPSAEGGWLVLHTRCADERGITTYDTDPNA